MKLKSTLVSLLLLGCTVENYAGESKWVTPSNNACIAYGGKISNGFCLASWSKAKDICTVSHGRLPILSELKKVVIDCGGIINNSGNKKYHSYQNCYKRKGFGFGNYWSSSISTGYTNGAWGVHFGSGYMSYDDKIFNKYIRCVRGVGE